MVEATNPQTWMGVDVNNEQCSSGMLGRFDGAAKDRKEERKVFAKAGNLSRSSLQHSHHTRSVH